MYSSDGKSGSKFQRRVSHGLPGESLEKKRRRILSGLSVISQKKRLGKKVTFHVSGYNLGLYGTTVPMVLGLMQLALPKKKDQYLSCSCGFETFYVLQVSSATRC